MCGQIDYSLRAISYEENPVTPLIVMDGPLLIMAPSAAFSPGTYELELVGTLQDYPTISGAEKFSIKVTDCAATLVTDGLTGDIYLSNAWYVADEGTSFLPVIDTLDQQPNCFFGFTYELWKETPSGDLLPPPPAVSIDKHTGAIFIDKCVDPDSPDPECQSAPYAASYELVLRAILNDGGQGSPEEQFVDIPVLAELTTPCAANTIELVDTVDVIEYVIQTPAESFVYQPLLTAKFERCPVLCHLVEMPDELDYNLEVVADW